MPVSLVFIAIIVVAFGLLAWRDFRFALTLIIALLPTYLIRFELVIPWTVLETFILIAFALWLFRHYGHKLDLRTLNVYRAPIFFLLAIATFATTWAPEQMSALGVWKAFFIEPMLMFVMLRTTFTDRADWERALTGLGLTTIAIAAFAIFQKLTGLGLPIPWDLERRATSVFEYPNALGLFVAPVVSALVVMSFCKMTAPSNSPMAGGGRLARVIAIVFGIVAIVLSETEAALVAIPIALVATLLISSVPNKTKIAALVGSAVIGITLLAAVPVIREKILLQDYSGGVRRSQWSETIELLKDEPLQGAGLSGYPVALEPYHDPRLYEIFQYPHNVILNFWVEMGVFGVIAFLFIAITVCKLTWARRDDVVVLAAFAALLTMTVHGLVDVPFFKNDLAVLTAFFLAMTLVPSRHPDVRKDTVKF
ncbi:MAG: O-antigen ligase family protein [Patescibacteria group bacterium]